jgi:hypothetical protein
VSLARAGAVPENGKRRREMESKNGTAILTLSTDKKSRPICSVADIEVSKQKGSEGWLHITLSTGTQIHFSREATEAIRTKLTTVPVSVV